MERRSFAETRAKSPGKYHGTEVVVRVVKKGLAVHKGRRGKRASRIASLRPSSIFGTFFRRDYSAVKIAHSSRSISLFMNVRSPRRKTVSGAQLYSGEPDLHQRGGEMRAGIRRRASPEIRPGGLSRRRRLPHQRPTSLQRLQPGRADLRPRRAGGLGRGWRSRGGLRGKRQGTKSTGHPQRGHLSRCRETNR